MIMSMYSHSWAGSTIERLPLYEQVVGDSNIHTILIFLFICMQALYAIFEEIYISCSESTMPHPISEKEVLSLYLVLKCLYSETKETLIQ